MQQGTPVEIANLPWDGIRTVLLTLCTLGVGFLVARIKDVTLVKNIVVGVDGRNGLRSRMEKVEKKIEKLIAYNIAVEAVHEAEMDQLGGRPDRRHERRRLADKLQDEILGGEK